MHVLFLGRIFEYPCSHPEFYALVDAIYHNDPIKRQGEQFNIS
jgi:hypothetical protein